MKIILFLSLMILNLVSKAETKVDSVFVCKASFKDSNFNNEHAGSGFLLKYNNKVYGITAKHVLFFAKTDNMKTVSFGDELESWTFQSKQNPKNKIRGIRLINENRNEKIEMPPKGDWLIFDVKDENLEDTHVFELRDSPIQKGEQVNFMGFPYNNAEPIKVQGTFSGYTKDGNLSLDVPNGNYRGCSGGPVFDSNGKLVGIVSMGYYNKKLQKHIFEPASLDYFKKVIDKTDKSFDQLKDEFYKGYTSLNIPELDVNYVNYLRNLSSKSELNKQQIFFEKMLKELSKVDSNKLKDLDLIDYHTMLYQSHLNLDRIGIEVKMKVPTKLKDSESIRSIDGGKKMYSHLLKRWVDLSVSPEELFEFGQQEIKKVISKMKRLRQESKLSDVAFEKFLNDETFLIKNEKDIQKSFEKTKEIVAKKAKEMFPYLDQIPDVNIQKGTNPALAHVPAYYGNNIFSYNLFDKPFNNRQIGWVYIHEAIPGHHYQISVNNVIKRTQIQNLFWYASYVEGWAAYIENLGSELDVYPTLYDEYGKWEWDLIRSVRICLDIGINYYGWSDEKSMKFWTQFIKNQDDIAQREIARMKRWPAQVISYKYGEKILLDLLKSAKEKPDFNYKHFHKIILKHGDLPLSILLKINDAVSVKKG